MFSARSAGTLVVLGATLIVTANTAIAAEGGAQALGIDSMGSLGIDSMGSQGIDSMGGLGIDSMGGLGLDSMGSQGIDSMGVLSGPVDRIDAMNGVFESMGQIVM